MSVLDDISGWFSDTGDAIGASPGAAVSSVVTAVDDIARDVVIDGYAGLVNELDRFIWMALTASLMLVALGLLMGWLETPTREMARKILRWMVVLTLIYNWAAFDRLVYHLFTQTPQFLAATVVTSSGLVTGDVSMVGLLDGVMEQAWLSAGDALQTQGYVIPYVMWGVILAASTVVCAYALGLICLAKIGLTIVLVLAPVFLIAYMFDVSRHLFNSWLQQVMNYGFISILTAIVLAFFVALLRDTIPIFEADAALVFSDVGRFLIVTLVMLLVLMQVPMMASGLVGGFQLGTLGAFSAGGRVAGAGARSTGSRLRALRGRLTGGAAGAVAKAS